MGRKASCRAKDCARAQCVKTHHQPASKLDLAARQRGEDLLELIGMKCVDIAADREGLQEEWRAHPVDLDLLYELKMLVRLDRFAWQIFNPWWQQASAYRIIYELDFKRPDLDASGMNDHETLEI